jgi:WD40 repeat protein
MSVKDSHTSELQERLMLRTESTRDTNSASALEPARAVNSQLGEIELIEISDPDKQFVTDQGKVNSVAAFQATLMEINPMKVKVPYESALLVKLLKTIDVGVYLAYSGAVPIITKYCFRTNSELHRKQMQISDFSKIIGSPDEVFLLILKERSFHIMLLNNLELVLNCETPSPIKRSSISRDSKVIYIHAEDGSIYAYKLHKKKLKQIFELGTYSLIEMLNEYAVLYDNKTLLVKFLASKQPPTQKLVNFSLANARVYANFDNTIGVFIDQVSKYLYIKQLPSLEDLIDYRLEEKPLKVFFTKGNKTLIVLYANFKLGVFSVLSKEKPITLDTLINIDKQHFHFNPITNMFYSNDILHDTYKWSFLEGNVEGLELNMHGGKFVKILRNRLYELQGTYINIRDLHTLQVQNKVHIPTIQSFGILESSGEDSIIIVYHSPSKFTLHNPADLEEKQEVFLEKCSFNKVLKVSKSNILVCADRNNIRFFDVEQGQIVRNVFAAQIYDISEMILASKSEILITTSRDKTLKIWSIQNSGCKFIDKLLYQDCEFSCLTVDHSEEFLMAGTRNGLVVVWHLHKHSLITSFEYSDEIIKILVTPNNRFFMVGDAYGNIHIGNFKTFTKITQFYVGNSLNDFCFDYQQMFLYTFSRNSTKRYKNFFVSDHFTIYGDVNDEWKYYTVLDDMCVKGKVPPHDPNFDKLIFSPGGINSLHIYVYFGLAKHLKKCLKERIVIIADRNGQTPIDMCIDLKDTELLGLFLNALIIEIPKNKYLATVFEDTLIKINYIGHPILDDLYRVLFRVCTDFGVPRFCDESVQLPISIKATKNLIDPEMFMAKEHYESKKNMISYKEALIPLSFNIGSEESIEFLKSIIECPNTEIFRTPLIREYLLGKWQIARKGMFIQMMLYILYMSSLLFHVF